ncbi:Fe-S cluster biogenesis protein NfuA, 4Fe-4S-binding domain [Sinomicrobium oceani]|uniref:Fe-S cluster biogenesis protein NfuA, 4Fe-4S-binding domain n=2 Tax=Sinomicrobium oceani TaxID=1150368 RepID=A0A1K1Q9N0_9FLAO|nr:Fe-S cluster biogenesis protein NfuA, 4Fe-4S-binding domain [Sinomicrobium oceani]
MLGGEKKIIRGEKPLKAVPQYHKLKKMTKEELKLNVEKALDEIRPFLKSDGGDISLVSIDDGKLVKVRLEGACTDCHVNHMTLKAGVETTIKKYAPQIERVIGVS